MHELTLNRLSQLLLALVLALAFCQSGWADDASTLRKSTHPVWFDPSAGTNGSIVEDQKPLMKSDVSDRIQSVADRQSRSWFEFLFGWVWGQNVPTGLSDFFSLLFSGWRLILLIFFVTLVLLLIWLLVRSKDFFYGRLRAKSGANQISLERERAKITDLPFDIEQPLVGLLQQAERLKNAGDYSGATIYLFSHVLIEMDAARCIRLERGKTNRAYIRELQKHQHEPLTSFTKKLVGAFEYAFFGKHLVPKEMFDQIWSDLPAFNSYLQNLNRSIVERGDVEPRLSQGIA